MQTVQIGNIYHFSGLEKQTFSYWSSRRFFKGTTLERNIIISCFDWLKFQFQTFFSTEDVWKISKINEKDD